MLVFLLKSSQLGLFDKLVPVKASVTHEGVVRAPHMAIRKVRLPAAPAPEHHHAAPDLFGEPRAAAPKPEPKAKPKAAESLDLFANLEKPDTSPKPVKEPAKTEHVEAEAKPIRPARVARLRKPREPAAVAQAVEAHVAPPSGGIDYSHGYDPSAVPSFGVPVGTSKGQRRKINAECGDAYISRFKTPDRNLLRQYSGNGGCGDSLNEFYTDPHVAAAMWAALTGMGLREGATVLEPSCATGVFIETAPKGVRVTGVELDPISAKIGETLHPDHEVQNASLERFATQDTRQFDAVIGNAPFGLRGGLIKDDKPDLANAEAYFLDTALDKTRDGGLVALIVGTGVMRGKNARAVRERLLRKGEFLGAMRMPNTAFESSNIDVTTDVLFFRKRPQPVAGALTAKIEGKYAVDQATLKQLGVWDDEFLSGSYFEERGAKNVLGTVGTAMRQHGEIYAVEGSMQGVPEAIAAFEPDAPGGPTDVAAILSAIPDEDRRARAAAGAESKPYDSSKRGDVKVVDGVQYVLEGEPLRWHRVDEFMQRESVTAAESLAEEIERAIKDDGYAAASNLADKVREYVKAHGIPSKNPDLMLAATQNKVLYRLVGAVKPDGSLSDLVEGRHSQTVESSFDAAAQSLALEGVWFKPEQVAARWHGGDSEAVLDHLYASPDYALDPVSGMWTSTDQYLSGELWPKLDEAKAALAREDVKPEDRAKYERQAELLEATIDPKSLEDVEVAINSAFLPLKVVEGFFNHRLAEFRKESTYSSPPEMTVAFDKGVYTVSGGLWGDTSLLDKYLNRSGVKKDDWPTVERWNAEFKAWLCASPFRDEVETLYNRGFRGFRQREYAETPFEIPGLNATGIKPHIYSGIRQALEMGKGILADDVGLGKTVQGLILARMAKVTGKAKRPMIIVPKSVLANWVAEAEKWFPGTSVLVIGETYTRSKDGSLKGKQDTAAERKRKYHDLTQNEYDFILISQPAWNDLDVDPITKGEYLEDDFWVQRGDSLGKAGDKRVEKAREGAKQANAKREFQTRTDALYFNDLGVDMLIGDEMHAYKNLYAAKNRFGEQPKFLGGQGLSNRAFDMAFKARWVRDHNDGSNVYGLTATPTKNSPLEVYSMLSYMAPEAFEKLGIRNSEEFLDRFCDFKQENILTTSGRIEEATVTAGFKNLDELREIMRRFINRRTADSVGLKLPARDDRMHMVEMSAEQKAVYAELRVLAEESAGSRDASGDAHIFSIMDKMAKAAMDLELYDSGTYAGAKSPKYAEAAAHIAEGAKEGGQVVFADNIGVHDKMVAALVERGIPREEIAVLNAQVAASSAARQNIADAFNSGKLKVVIGNTATMGEGINLQKGTTDIHHMDLPWEPASMQQRNGRGLRQGNTSEAVRIHTYIAKGSFDGYRYQTMAAKKGWMDLLWNGGDKVENLAREGALSRDDMMVMLAADPDAAREELTKNKAAAQERFLAQKNTEAAQEFDRFQSMKRSLAGLKNKQSPAAERLRVRVERIRTGLEANEHFKAKAALDSTHPVLIQPETGVAFERGTAFEAAPDSAIEGGGKFVVTGFAPDGSKPAVMVRRYGEAKSQPLALSLDKLGKGVAPFDYDEAAESRDISAHLEAAMAAKVNNITGMKDLHGMPSSLIEANYDTLQRQVKEGLTSYKFHMGYGGVGLVGADGKAEAASDYRAKEKFATHEIMLPTDKHRRLATDAYIADERAKKLVREYRQSGGRKARFNGGNSIDAVRYPDEYGHSGHTNRWGPILDNVFGTGAKAAAHAEYQRVQTDEARHAPTFKDAFGHAWKAATGEYGSVGAWPRRTLAVLWAKAKKEGVLNDPMPSHTAAGVPVGVFNTVSGTSVSHKPVREALIAMAAARGYGDLATAMIVSAAPNPQAAVRELMTLPPSAQKKMGPALQHLIAKEPALANRPAEDFIDHYSTSARLAVRGKTLADLAEPDDTPETRDAA